MMREIKFRAWDKLKKTMIPKSFTTLCAGGDIATLSEYVPHNGGYALKSVRQLSNYEYDNLILMQYTGLKDKNGKEIYEGDIVQTKYETMPPVSILWRDGGFYYSPPKKDPKDGGMFCVCKFTTESDEVIGTIYENPELMEAKE